MGYCTGTEHKVVTNGNSQSWRGATLCPSAAARWQALTCRSGEPADESNIPTRVLADGAQNAFSERLLGRAGGNAGVLNSDAAEPRPLRRPCGLTAWVCGLSIDLLHGDRALCVARWCCIETIGITRALL